MKGCVVTGVILRRGSRWRTRSGDEGQQASLSISTLPAQDACPVRVQWWASGYTPLAQHRTSTGWMSPVRRDSVLT